MAQGEAINIGSLSDQQLEYFQTSLRADLDSLTESQLALQRAAGEFGASGRAVESLSTQKAGQPMLVPLTQSLYVAGELADTENVLIDIGTGYYIEKSTDGAIDFCKRRVQLLAENLDKLNQLRQQKLEALMQVNQAVAARQRGQPAKKEVAYEKP